MKSIFLLESTQFNVAFKAYPLNIDEYLSDSVDDDECQVLLYEYVSL